MDSAAAPLRLATFSSPPRTGSNDIRSQTPLSSREAPSCVQNAMMNKEKKPFTYTPGGLDLSEIRSEKMAKRLMRNAMSPGVQERPKAPQFPTGETPAPKTSAHYFNLPVAVFPCIQIPANPKELLRKTSGAYIREDSVDQSAIDRNSTRRDTFSSSYSPDKTPRLKTPEKSLVVETDTLTMEEKKSKFSPAKGTEKSDEKVRCSVEKETRLTSFDQFVNNSGPKISETKTNGFVPRIEKLSESTEERSSDRDATDQSSAVETSDKSEPVDKKLEEDETVTTIKSSFAENKMENKPEVSPSSSEIGEPIIATLKITPQNKIQETITQESAKKMDKSNGVQPKNESKKDIIPDSSRESSYEYMEVTDDSDNSQSEREMTPVKMSPSSALQKKTDPAKVIQPKTELKVVEKTANSSRESSSEYIEVSDESDSTQSEDEDKPNIITKSNKEAPKKVNNTNVVQPKSEPKVVKKLDSSRESSSEYIEVSDDSDTAQSKSVKTTGSSIETTKITESSKVVQTENELKTESNITSTIESSSENCKTQDENDKPQSDNVQEPIKILDPSEALPNKPNEIEIEKSENDVKTVETINSLKESPTKLDSSEVIESEKSEMSNEIIESSVSKIEGSEILKSVNEIETIQETSSLQESSKLLDDDKPVQSEEKLNAVETTDTSKESQKDLNENEILCTEIGPQKIIDTVPSTIEIDTKQFDSVLSDLQTVKTNIGNSFIRSISRERSIGRPSPIIQTLSPDPTKGRNSFTRSPSKDRASSDGMRILNSDLDNIPSLNICPKRFSFLRENSPKPVEDPFSILTGISPKISYENNDLQFKRNEQNNVEVAPPWENVSDTPFSINENRYMPEEQPIPASTWKNPYCSNIRSPNSFKQQLKQNERIDESWKNDLWNNTRSNETAMHVNFIAKEDSEPSWRRELREIASQKRDSVVANDDYKIVEEPPWRRELRELSQVRNQKQPCVETSSTVDAPWNSFENSNTYSTFTTEVQTSFSPLQSNFTPEVKPTFDARANSYVADTRHTYCPPSNTYMPEVQLSYAPPPPPTWSQTMRPKSWRERNAELTKEREAETPEWKNTGIIRKSFVNSFLKNTQETYITTTDNQKMPEITVEIAAQPNSNRVAQPSNNGYTYPWETSSESSVAFSPEPFHYERTPTPQSRNSPYRPNSQYSTHSYNSSPVVPREYGTLSFQPTRRQQVRSCPVQSRSFKYLQLLTGTDDSYEDDEPYIPQPAHHAHLRPESFN